MSAYAGQGRSEISGGLLAALDELAEVVARRVAELVREEKGEGADSHNASPWLSVGSAAAYLDWPRERLYKLTARGAIPHYKHEGRLAFRRDELDRWLERHAQGERDWMRGGGWS